MDGRICVVCHDERIIEGDLLEQTRKLLDRFIENEDVEGILVNIGKAHRLASSGIGLMAGTHKAMSDRGKRFAMCNLSDRHKQLFVMTKLAGLLEIYSSEDEALAKMRLPREKPV
jgi:anti-anti-sigma factor